jgi:hypothetical protein
MRIEATPESTRTVIRPAGGGVGQQEGTGGGHGRGGGKGGGHGCGGAAGGGQQGKGPGEGGGDRRGTSQWPKVMGTHINAYPGSEHNGYTLVSLMQVVVSSCCTSETNGKF